MVRGFRWFALAFAVAVAALVGPTAAFATDCSNVSAGDIYSEPCVPDATGGHKHPAKPSTPPQTYTTPYYHVESVAPAPKPQPAHHPKSKKPERVVSNRGLLKPDEQVAAPLLLISGPTSRSSAFDLGSGPTILLALLAGTVLLLLGTGGVRTWRNRHRV